MRRRWTFWQFDFCIGSADVRAECSSGEMWEKELMGPQRERENSESRREREQRWT